jgi:hypothetical protein
MLRKSITLPNHYRNYPCVLVRLGRVDEDAIRDLLRMGWNFMSKKARKKRTPSKTASNR